MSYESNVLETGALEMAAAAPVSSPSSSASLSRDLSRLGSGLLLAAVYGLALGARAGGTELLRHACGAPLGLAVVAAVAAPSLFVRLALIDAPLRPAQLIAAVSRGTFATGLVLAGLAPAATLLVVSIESARAAAWMSGLGLWLAGGIGLLNVLSALHGALAVADDNVRSRAWLSVMIFALLSVALAARAWYAWLPLLAGAS
jgi:hypothetical protein